MKLYIETSLSQLTRLDSTSSWPHGDATDRGRVVSKQLCFSKRRAGLFFSVHTVAFIKQREFDTNIGIHGNLSLPKHASNVSAPGCDYKIKVVATKAMSRSQKHQQKQQTADRSFAECLHLTKGYRQSLIQQRTLLPSAGYQIFDKRLYQMPTILDNDINKKTLKK